MLGALKAGAAYVPLDSETPPERLRFILKDSGAKCLITLSGLTEALADAPPRLLLDTDQSEIANCSSTRLSRDQTSASRNDLCYIIYTSGTTGRPKGVLIEHRNVTHLVRAESQLYGIRSEDRVFQLASPAFDASVEEIWMAFFHGATLVAGTPDILLSGPDFPLHMERLGVTVLSCVPTFLSMLERDISTVRLLILGGEACPSGLADRWQRPGRVIVNTYGPTETTVIATASVLSPQRNVTIGRPIANCIVFLIDEKGLPVPNGLPGDLRKKLLQLNANLNHRVAEAVAAEREAQRMLRDGQRLTMLGEATAQIAHEIRNPLVAIGGFAFRIQKQIPRDHAAQSGLSIITQEIGRLELLLKELLELASPRESTSGQVNLDGMVKEVLALARPSIEQHRVKLSVESPARPLIIEGNADHLKSALLNVVLNAIQAMPEGGELTLALRCTCKGAIDGVAITVQDTGIGITPENLPKIFDPFFTSKPGGTGLGLAVVKKAIDAHGGRVDIASSPRDGTLVAIWLPLWRNGP